MNPSIEEFLNFLDKEDDTDYGDFKREVDLHLLHMSQALRPLSVEQVWQLRKMRENLLWKYQDNIEEMRSQLRSEVQHLEAYGTLDS